MYTIPTPKGNRTVASIAEVLSAGVIDPINRDNWEAAYVGAVWRLSKGSGSAVIIHPTVCEPGYAAGEVRPVPSHMTALQWYNYRLDAHRGENDRRTLANDYVCAVVLMGYVEGRDALARKLAEAMGSDGMTASALADDSVPSYTQMRNFLMGELDAHPVTAAAAAMRSRAFHNKLALPRRAEYYGSRSRVPDTGWL